MLYMYMIFSIQTSNVITLWCEFTPVTVEHTRSTYYIHGQRDVVMTAFSKPQKQKRRELKSGSKYHIICCNTCNWTYMRKENTHKLEDRWRITWINYITEEKLHKICYSKLKWYNLYFKFRLYDGPSVKEKIFKTKISPPYFWGRKYI